MASTLRRRIVVTVQDREFVRHHGNLRQYLGLSKDGLQGAQRSFRGAGQAAERYGREAARGAERAGRAARENAREVGVLERGWRRLTAAIAGIAIGASLRFLYLLNGSMEQARIGFATLLGGADEAHAFLKRLVDFAARTPFEMPGLIQASRQLLAFGFQAEHVIPMLTAVGDAVAAMGGGTDMLDGVIRALGQMQAKGRVSAEEMMQLAERGIPAWQLLADKIGTSIPEAMKRAERGTITGAQGINAILEGMAERFGGAMEAQSRTAFGLMSTLLDLFRETAREVSALAFEELKSDIEGVTDEVQRLRSSGRLAEWAREVAEALRAAYQITRRVLAALIEWGPTLLRVGAGYAALAVAVKAFTAAMVIKNGVLTVGRALWQTYHAALILASAAKYRLLGQTRAVTIAMTAFNTVVRANPLGILVTAVTVLGGAFLLLRDRTDSATEGFQKMEDQARATRRELEAMAGAELRAAEAANRAVIATRGRTLESVRGRIGAIERGEVTFDDVVHETGEGPFVVTGAELAARELVRLRQQERDLMVEIGTIQSDNRLIEHRTTTELGTRLEYLVARREALLREGKETQELRDLNAEIAALEKEQARLRAAGLPDGGSGGGGDKGRANELKKAADALREVQQATRLYAATSEEGRQVLQDLFRAEDDLAKLERARAELVRFFGQQGEEAYKARRAQLDAEIERLRSMAGAWESVGAAAREAARQWIARSTSFPTPPNDPRGGRFAAGRVGGLDLLPDFDVMTTISGLREVQAYAAAYRKELAALAIARERGTLGEREYARASLEASARAREGVLAVLAAMERLGLVTPEVRSEVADFLDGLPERTAQAVQELDELIERLGHVTALADEAANLFAALGATDLSNLIRGLGDVTAALERQARVRRDIEAGILEGTNATLAEAGAGLGVIGAIAGAAGSFVSAINEHRERQRALETSIIENTRAVQDNTRSILSGFIGGDLTEAQAEALRAVLEDPRFTSLFSGVRSLEGHSMDRALLRDLGRDFFDALAAEGFDVSELRRLFEEAVAAGNWEQMWAAIDETTARFGGLIDNLRTYSDDFAGAMQRFSDAVEFLGLEGQAAFEAFLDSLRSLDLGPEWAAILDQFRGIDVSTAQGQAELEATVAAVWQAILANPAMLPDEMTFDEFRDFLRQALRFGGAAGGQGTRGTQVARTITEIQANELVALTHEGLLEERRQTGHLAELVALARRLAEGAAPPEAGAGSPGGGGGSTVHVHLTVHPPQPSYREVAAAIERDLRRARVFG